MRTLYFDCFSGAAGDMILGSLIDAGVPLEEVRRALGSLAIASDTVWTERVTRAGLSATKFWVRGEHQEPDHADDHRGPQAHDHPHDHPHDDAPRRYHRHRTLAEIADLIDGFLYEANERLRAVTHRL